MALIVGVEYGAAAASLIGLLLAFVAPLVILRRILKSPVITVRLVLGALAIYLLLGLAYAYLYPVIGFVTNEPFFVQTTSPEDIDFVYFSYVTLTTVGYGDFTAATSTGRMIAVSEALTGQLYLVSAVALLVGNIGRTIVRGGPATGIEIEPLTDGGSRRRGFARRRLSTRRATRLRVPSSASARIRRVACQSRPRRPGRLADATAPRPRVRSPARS